MTTPIALRPSTSVADPTLRAFLEAVQQVAHRLPHLVLDGGGVDAAVGAGDEGRFGGTIERIGGENAGATTQDRPNRR